MISLDGGKDGLRFYYRLDIIASNNLVKNGWMFMEHGINMRGKIIDIFYGKDYIINVYDDLAKINRVIAIQYIG